MVQKSDFAVLLDATSPIERIKALFADDRGAKRNRPFQQMERAVLF
jgi:hypothetical protein